MYAMTVFKSYQEIVDWHHANPGQCPRCLAYHDQKGITCASCHEIWASSNKGEDDERVTYLKMINSLSRPNGFCSICSKPFYGELDYVCPSCL